MKDLFVFLDGKPLDEKIVENRVSCIDLNFVFKYEAHFQRFPTTIKKKSGQGGKNKKIKKLSNFKN